MKNKFLFYLCIILFQNNKLSDDLERIMNFITYGFLGASSLLGIGLGIEYIARDIIVTDYYLNMLKKRLNSEQYWQNEKKNATDEEIIMRKKKLNYDIEKMEKIKADRKKKKEEKEARKKQISEEGFAPKNANPNPLYRFFLFKKETQLLNYNIVPMQQTLHYMNGNPYSTSYQFRLQIGNIFEKIYTRYNTYNNTVSKNKLLQDEIKSNRYDNYTCSA